MKTWSWRSFVIGLVLAGVAVGVPFAVHVANDATQAAYVECLNAQGFYQGDPSVNLEDLAVAASNC